MSTQPQEADIQKQAIARVGEFFRTVAPRFSEKKETRLREVDSSIPDQAEAFRTSIATLADPNASPVERNRVVVTLGHLANPEAVPVLLKFITSSEVPVAQNAIRALGEIKDTRSVPPLLKLVEDPPQLEEEDVHVLQARAISALGAIGDASALDALKKVATRAELPENLRESVKTAMHRIEKRRSQTSTESPANTTAR
ncbi:MAG: HEAT repeat domain-containing protein [Candidatus Eisenbacteria bacterium]|nr:HEAT repeat domain-containing protein [Candidatus Eisenbacteria bacterium]